MLAQALIAVMAVSLGLCMWQEWVPKPYGFKNRSAVLVSANVLPESWYAGGSYLDTRAPVVAVPPGRTLIIPPSPQPGSGLCAPVAAA